MLKLFFGGWDYNLLFTCDVYIMGVYNNGTEIRVGQDKAVANIAPVIDYGQNRFECTMFIKSPKSEISKRWIDLSPSKFDSLFRCRK